MTDKKTLWKTVKPLFTDLFLRPFFKKSKITEQILGQEQIVSEKMIFSRNVRATAKIDSNYIESKKEQVLLGVTIDSNLTFENHINNICKRAIQKLNAVPRFAPYINMQKEK